MLGQHKPLPFGAKQGRGRNADLLKLQFGVADPPGSCVAHHRNVADVDESGGVLGHEDHRGPLVRRRVRVGDRHHDAERRTICSSRKPLAPGNHILIAVAHGLGVQHDRIRPGGVGFRHRKATADFAAHHAAQPLLLLRIRAVHVHQFNVACVRRLSAKAVQPQRSAPQHLQHERVTEQVPALSAPLLGVVRSPPAAFADLVSDGFRIRFDGGKPARQQFWLQGDHMGVNEFAQFGEPRLQVLRNREIHEAYASKPPSTTKDDPVV